MNAVLLGIPLDLGAKNLGVDIGPNAFRRNGIIEKLKNVSIDVEDLGDVKCKDRKKLNSGDTSLKYMNEIIRVSKNAAKIAEDSIKSGKKFIALGGDHSINLGVFSGASAATDGDLGMIYFDAHGDLNTFETTLSGNIHGMHLASLLGFGNKELVNVYKKGEKLKKENLLHIGGTDFDVAEKRLVKEQGIDCYMMNDLLAHGMGPLFQKIKELQKRVKNMWISLDLDSIDNVYAPGAGMQNRGGLTYREIVALANYIGKYNNIVGIDIVEYNPLLDREQITAELGIELIAKFLGSNYSWYTNYMDSNRV